MSSAEKGEVIPPVSQSRTSSSDGDVGAVKESWATRNGFNLRSFTKKESGADIELERPMKTRHLHMISIGKLETVHGIAVGVGSVDEPF